MTITLEQSVQYLKSVGPHRAKLLARMGITTVRDLLGHFPREYDDRRTTAKIGTAAGGTKIAIKGTVQAVDTVSLNRNLTVFKAAVSDGTGVAFAMFYRKANPYHRHDVFASLRQIFSPRRQVYLYGTFELHFGERQLNVEEYEAVGDGEPVHFNRIVPVYALTEGVGQKWFREFVRKNLDALAPLWQEILPEHRRREQDFPDAPAALKDIHFPEDLAAAECARRRLAFDEYLMLETALTLARRDKREYRKPVTYEVRKSLLTPFREMLKFEFTAAQKRVINEIFTDMRAERPMNRLLMGDVGSGKTVVALSAILLAIENGYQAVLLAPTEILAEQHFVTIRQMLAGLPVRVELLTGKMSGRQKAKGALLAEIADGKVNLVIGTHAVLEKSVAFKNLALIVIDEQHRFGVMQRAMLQTKTRLPDVLLMTATPIPRSLALTLYGDMDVSAIESLPPGRKPIETLHCSSGEAYALVKNEVRRGRQAYIVYPLVEESDKIELKAAVKEAGELSGSVFREFRVGLLHGQMKTEEKQNAMIAFREKKTDILISTTVIEVGIDVPNATVMVIEHAERFGLATLHQLRGRVGRGGEKSYCLLLGVPKTPEAHKRIEVMTRTGNGFKIAEEDLALRGPGEFFGTAQHGLPELKAGNLVTDGSLIECARAAAHDILADDPRLALAVNHPLRQELFRVYGARMSLIKIG
jgi:ATP-dependent DNA helicase RecG